MGGSKAAQPLNAGQRFTSGFRLKIPPKAKKILASPILINVNKSKYAGSLLSFYPHSYTYRQMSDTSIPIVNSDTASLTASMESRKHYTDAEIEALAISVLELRNQVKSLMVTKGIEATMAPASLVTPIVNDYFKQKYKLGRPPTEGEIKHAISKTKDMRQASEYLGISIYTLKRYCLYFAEAGGSPLWQPRRGSKAIKPIMGDTYVEPTPSKSTKPAFKDKSFFNFNQPLSSSV